MAPRRHRRDGRGRRRCVDPPGRHTGRHRQGAWRPPSQGARRRPAGRGAKVLGNIEIGRHAKVGGQRGAEAGAARRHRGGVPARIVGWTSSPQAPAEEMDMSLPEPDYTI
ncbi:hypothetical protein Lal_00014314 [Lupinus albus]|nr:hypothetical protein Lal_00014314 [Lupinus albus]